VRAYNWMLANTDALGTFPTHYRDQATGWPLSIQQHPYATLDDWAWANTASRSNSATGQKYKADLLPNCTNNPVVSSCKASSYGTGNPYGWSNAHQPAAGYVAYMVTGSYYYMEEMAYYASMSELSANETYRGFSQGLIDAARSQVRGKAWVLREMVDAAWLLPDAYPLKAEFNADVNNSIADFNATYTHNADANPLGMMNSGSLYSMNGETKNGGTPWQHNFLIWSVGHAAELGFVGAADFRNWLAKFEIGLMTDWETSSPQGYCWLQASAYNVQVKDASGNWLPSFTAVNAATWPTLKALACNSPAMLTELAKIRSQPTQAGEMQGYANSATGYPANFQIGLAAAANSGLPNAQAAWNLFDSRSVKPSGSTAYNNYPNYAVIPRSVSSVPADQAIITNPIPTPTPPPTTPPPPPTIPPPVSPAPPVTSAPPVVPAKPTAPSNPPAPDWRRSVPANVVARVLNVMDGVFSYSEVAPQLLSSAFISIVQPPALHVTSQVQKSLANAPLTPPPQTTSPVQRASAIPTAQSAAKPTALPAQPANSTATVPAQSANTGSLPPGSLDRECRTSSGSRLTQLECSRQWSLRNTN
jgi:hypothetical protein